MAFLPGLFACSQGPTDRGDIGGSTPASPSAGVLAASTRGLVHAYTAEGKTAYYRDCGDPSDGLNHCMIRVPTNADGVTTPATSPSGWGAGDLQSAYSIPTNGGSGQTVAIIDALDNPSVEADLAAYRSQFGMSPCTTANGCFKKVNANGAASPLPASAKGSNWGTEIALDVEMVSAACPNCNIILIETNGTGDGDLMSTATQTAMNMGAQFISDSFSRGEASSDPSNDASKFNHPGVSIFAAAGDGGFGVGYPASSFYVTAVGGTVLSKDSSARGWSETVWGGTGSGCSQFISKPWWQSDSGCSKRTVNDVSAVATGVAMYDTLNSGGWLTVGGTSVATPLIAGMYAASFNNGAGPSFSYGAFGSFNDVTTGTNTTSCSSYLCNAGSGYDGPTGNGTPIGNLLAAEPPVSTVSWSANRLDSFGRGLDGSVYHKAWDGAEWLPSVTDWEDLGGVTTSTPEAVSWGPNRLDLFVRGASEGLFHKAWDGAEWLPSTSGWENLGGAFIGHPTAVSWGANRLDIFVVGTDNALYHKAWNGSAWLPSTDGFEKLGGFFRGPIKAVSWGPNRLDVFGMGGDGALYHKAWDGAEWLPASGFESLGGNLIGAPAVASWGPNRLDIFALGTDSALYHKAWDGSAWLPSTSNWEFLGGAILGSPAVASWGPNRLDILVRGTDSVVYHKAWTGSAWAPSATGYEGLGGSVIASPTLASWGPNRLDSFVIGGDDAVYHKAWDGSEWLPSATGWEDLSGAFAW